MPSGSTRRAKPHIVPVPTLYGSLNRVIHSIITKFPSKGIPTPVSSAHRELASRYITEIQKLTSTDPKNLKLHDALAEAVEFQRKILCGSASSVDKNDSDSNDESQADNTTDSKKGKTRARPTASRSLSIRKNVKIHEPPCNACKKSGATCFTSTGKSMRPRISCDCCRSNKQACSLIAKHKLEEAEKEQEESDEEDEMPPPPAKKQRLSAVSTGSLIVGSSLPSSKVSVKKTSRDTGEESSASGHQTRPKPKAKPEEMRPASQDSNESAKPKPEQTQDKHGLEDLHQSRGNFLAALDAYKTELGGVQTKTFKELFLAAKLWVAQEEMLLE